MSVVSPVIPPHKAEVGRAWRLAAAAEINKHWGFWLDRVPRSLGLRMCGYECLPWEEAMRTELQLESRSSGNEREVGAYGN